MIKEFFIMSAMIPDAVREMIQAKCAELGYELFDSRSFMAGSRMVLRITIDAPAGEDVL